MSEHIYEVTTDSDGVDCYIKRGEIVRCKDCKHYDRGRCYLLQQLDDIRKEEDFCSYGERKEE